VTATAAAATAAAAAHNVDQSYLYLRVYEDSINFVVEITAADLERALDLGWDTEERATLPQVQERLDEIREYVEARFEVSTADRGVWEPRFRRVSILSVGFGDFVQLEYVVDDLDEIPDLMEISFNVLFEVAQFHRNWVIIGHNWMTATFNNEAIPSLILSPNNYTQTLDLTSSSWVRGFIGLIWLGVLHIWIGIDHILFLVALVLPSVLIRRNGAFQPVGDFKSAFTNILFIVTSFTLAHSVTLALAGLEIVTLPSRLVEAIIAGSIAVAAAANLMPNLRVKEWMIAFGFGLFHGFGFASVMGDIGVGRDHLALSVFGFNVGVEIGQVAILVVIFPILYALRRQSYYNGLMKLGSCGLIAIALVWFGERAFGFNFPMIDTLLFIPRWVASLFSGGA
jgi:hypothetical protein